jgi:Zn-dependent peptidase ImmA (M78 family)
MNGVFTIWKAVEEFRRQHIPESTLPVDIFTVVELRLRLDVIPFPSLSREYGVEAALTENFTGIYIDEEAYILWEEGPPWKQNRVRFSVAHEVGHYILHREAAAKIKFKTFADFARYFNDHDGPRYQLEQEANEFAGRLLVPRERLEAFFDAFVESIRKAMPRWWDSGELRQKFADSIAPKFGVHPQSILTRLEREEIWPAP